jgi:hypothetical protein
MYIRRMASLVPQICNINFQKLTVFYLNFAGELRKACNLVLGGPNPPSLFPDVLLLLTSFPETVCNRDCRASLESAVVALHACLSHGVKTNCSFAAAFGGVMPGLRVPPVGLGQEEERERAIVTGWLKRAIVQGKTMFCLFAWIRSMSVFL